jgi:phage virion morphogenesis protein
MTGTVTLVITSDNITPALQKALAGVSDTSPLMAEIREYMFVQAKQNFSNEQGPDGSVWAPRSPATLASYLRQGKPVGKILQSEGSLIGTLGTDSGNGFAEVFVNQPYAAVMQFGAEKGAFGKTKRNGPIPWGDIPARPFLGFALPQEEAIEEIVTDWLADLFE